MGKKEVTMKGSMMLKTAVFTTFFQKRVFRWCISKYTTLEPGHLYYQVFISNGLNYVYKLIKAREKLFIAFQCDYSNAHGIFTLNNGPIIEMLEAVEISDGLYVGNFPDSLILHKNGAYQKIGLVNIAFRFLIDSSTSVQYNPVGEIGSQFDFDQLCHDLQTGFIDSKDFDFILKFDNVFIKTHKWVLYARSEFFQEYFTKDEEATEFSVPDISPGIMFEVLLYMYSGELTDINAECMVKVLEVAYLLKMSPLKERCLNYFEETDSWEAIEGVEFSEYKIV